MHVYKKKQVNMNLFFHPCMFPEIYKMAVYHKQAREQVEWMRAEAKRLKINAKYVCKHCNTGEVNGQKAT